MRLNVKALAMTPSWGVATTIAVCVGLVSTGPILAQGVAEMHGAAQGADKAVAHAERSSVAEGASLAKSKNCLGCHQIDTKRVGPGFVAVAKRYSSIDAPIDYLAGSIRQGGGGRWGAVPMPAQSQVSLSDAKQIAVWILSLSKQ